MSVPGKFLNQENIIKKVFDETTDSLRTTTSGTTTVIIDATTDSIAIGDSNTGETAPVDAVNGLKINGTVELGPDSLDALENINVTVVNNEVEIKNDIGNPVPVNATDFDIRNLTFATDSTDVSGSDVNAIQSGTWDINNINGTISLPDGAATAANQTTANTSLASIDSKLTSPIVISDGGDSLTVDANNLDIRDLSFSSDKVDASGSTVALDATTLSALESVTVQNASGADAVNIQDGGNSITVDGTVNVGNFPITQDVNVISSVEVEIKNDGGNPIPVNGTVAATQSGTWNIGTVSTVTNVVHVDDNAGSLTVDNNGTFAVQSAQSGSWSVTANAGTNLNTSALALETTQTAQNTLIGAVTETAPANDTASSGLNGRLQRIAQRLTSLIALLPTALGQGTMSNSFKVVLPSDQSTINTYPDLTPSVTAGNIYSISFSTLNQTTASTDNPLILIKNPSGNTVNMYIKSIDCSVSIVNVQSTFSAYLNPTITTNGTSRTPVNRNVGSGNVSTAQSFSLPTVSASGTLASAMSYAQNGSTVSLVYPYEIKLQPNNNLLITGNPASNNRNAVITVVWEEK